jgi:hypothetical protein
MRGRATAVSTSLATPTSGAASALPGYLDEFVFRFNRRRSRSRGLVFYRVLTLAVGHDPVRYRDLIARKRPAKPAQVPPRTRGKPPSLERPPADRPWRSADYKQLNSG